MVLVVVVVVVVGGGSVRLVYYMCGACLPDTVATLALTAWFCFTFSRQVLLLLLLFLYSLSTEEQQIAAIKAHTHKCIHIYTHRERE